MIWTSQEASPTCFRESTSLCLMGADCMQRQISCALCHLLCVLQSLHNWHQSFCLYLNRSKNHFYPKRKVKGDTSNSGMEQWQLHLMMPNNAMYFAWILDSLCCSFSVLLFGRKFFSSLSAESTCLSWEAFWHNGIFLRFWLRSCDTYFVLALWFFCR